MKQPYRLDISNYDQALRIKELVTIGHYFVFVADERALSAHRSIRNRLARLLVNPGEQGVRVLPLLREPIALAGAVITPERQTIDPMGCVVADRDLYRAEQDTVHLFVAMPHAPRDVRLVIECNGESFTERKLELDKGMCIEPLAMLLPGRYSAQLVASERAIGQKIWFTVAEYTLAPLSGSLVAHRLDRGQERLSFELAVESYQLAFDQALDVSLIDDGREVARQTIEPSAPGRFAGALSMRGQGPFRLRLQAARDAERVAEVVIPGSRATERETTVVSELGKEKLFSMMPEAGALRIRGGYVSEGDSLATPLTVDEVITGRRVIRTNTEVDALVLVTLDLATGQLEPREHGRVAAGSEIVVETDAAVATVFAGCFVKGRPFEGYTTFFRPPALGLRVSAPAMVRPRQELVVELACDSTAELPVLLCVRDQRLTATDTPEVGLGAAAKAGIAAATRDMADAGLTPLGDLLAEHMPDYFAAGLAAMEYSSVRYRRGSEPLPPPPKPVPSAPVLPAPSMPSGAPRPPSIRQSMPPAQLRSTAMPAPAMVLEESEGEADAAALRAMAAMAPAGDMARREGRQAARAEAAPGAGAEAAPEANMDPVRAAFPEVLFYGLVTVRGREEVRISLGDSLATLAVEAFALHAGDWAQTRTSVVVDQPVRADLELPPAVYARDKVLGRLRVAAASGQARVRLTRDGAAVALAPVQGQEAGRQDMIDDVVRTPVELVFAVAPGRYRAEVEDVASGERDSVEIEVGVPGKLKSLARQVALLAAGEALDLDAAGALTMRILPALDEPLGLLMKATAGYGHLCCEQTAAKILAATFMYLTAKEREQQHKAEEIILAGIAREQKMLRPGRGFTMYPDYDMVHEHYSRLATRYLWALTPLAQAQDISSSLRGAVQQGLSMADTAARVHGMERAPRLIQSMEDAHAAVTSGGDAAAARAYLDEALDFSGTEVRPRKPSHAVANRAMLAYASAALLALGDLRRGLRVANQVTQQLNAQGSLYSTVDSAAAIAMMLQLRASGVVSGKGRVRVNGRELSAAEAVALSDQVETIQVVDGVAAVEVTRVVEEDWDAFAADMAVRVGFRRAGDDKVVYFDMGDRVDLVVSLPDGYRPGDLLHVTLPACMAWIQGGGKVKRFTVDFEGKDEVRVPVIVTSAIDGKQHFAACVRNMFEEERAASPGLISVSGAARG